MRIFAKYAKYAAIACSHVRYKPVSLTWRLWRLILITYGTLTFAPPPPVLTTDLRRWSTHMLLVFIGNSLLYCFLVALGIATKNRVWSWVSMFYC